MNKNFEKMVGNNIRMMREKKGLTQDMLSAKLQTNGCDITRSALAKIEVGQRHLYIDELVLIKNILNIQFEDILTNTIPK
ncbi:MAG: helix-turn-helix transcriptional regulator [Clostridia bacterium]|nr:helix-turn-helix transcriptional regulator [Clostridia bacterium]